MYNPSSLTIQAPAPTNPFPSVIQNLSGEYIIPMKTNRPSDSNLHSIRAHLIETIRGLIIRYISVISLSNFLNQQQLTENMF